MFCSVFNNTRQHRGTYFRTSWSSPGGGVTLERDLFELQQLDLVLSLPNRSFRTVLRYNHARLRFTYIFGARLRVVSVAASPHARAWQTSAHDGLSTAAPYSPSWREDPRALRSLALDRPPDSSTKTHDARG